MDLSQSIIPKSDQLNADDLIAGPRTIRISAVKSGSAEQPITVHYDGDNGRPYKPGKSMRRILVAMWGSESDAYIGKRITLFREPGIRFGSDEVGGIRISHADIDRPLVLALTEKRGKRSQYRVDVIAKEKPQQTDSVAATRDLQTLCDIADGKISEGFMALTQWAEALPKAEKLIIGGKRFEEWKARASA
jgi:hypothetical protein